MKLPLLGALLLVLHNLQLDELDGPRSHNTLPCMGFKPRKFALEVLSRLTQRGDPSRGEPMTAVRYLSLQILPSWYTRRIRSLHVLCSLPLLYSTNTAGETK